MPRIRAWGHAIVKIVVGFVLVSLAAMSAVARAQDAAIGQVLYTNNCAPCHFDAKLNLFGVLAGANPSTILLEIQIYGPMNFLRPNPSGPITSVAQIDDIAAYLESVANPGSPPPPPPPPPPTQGNFVWAQSAVYVFGLQATGTQGAAQAIVVQNTGPGTAAVSDVTSSDAEFKVSGTTCTSVAANATCVVNVAFAPTTAGPHSSLLSIANDGATNPLVIPLSGEGATLAEANEETVIEYFETAFNHYFITPLAGEIQLLDARQPPFQDWVRTGGSFKANRATGAPAGAVGVCRFFNDNFLGTSTHFYAPHGLGCEQTIADFPDWTLEDPNLFLAVLPDANGNCPAGQIPVYRLYNNGMGGAPNHRFTTDPDVRMQMIAAGYAPEGAGVGVGWCAPQ
jgi:Abnormal spindle-like microcephaly-assoc'd, ASPM-SPD-2-Hydin/Repeat of unknown function (DUF5648)